MPKSITTPCDAAEHLHAAEGVTAYPDACMEPAPSDATLIAKALSDIARARCTHSRIS